MGSNKLSGTGPHGGGPTGPHGGGRAILPETLLLTSYLLFKDQAAEVLKCA